MSPSIKKVAWYQNFLCLLFTVCLTSEYMYHKLKTTNLKYLEGNYIAYLDCEVLQTLTLTIILHLPLTLPQIAI